MNKLLSIMAVLIFAMSTTLSAFAYNPCRPIARACMQAGYYKGGNNIGRGLVENCMLPVVAKRKVLAHASFSNRTLYQCKMAMREKIQEYR